MYTLAGFKWNFRGKLSLPVTPQTVAASKASSIKVGDVYQVNRFATGVQEKCGTGLFLPAENYIIPRRFSQTTQVNQNSIST